MKSDSLWTLIAQGRASGAIDSLFDETLASWRDTRSVMSEDTGSIAPELAKVFRHKNVRKRYLGEAAALGFQWEPAAIWEGFLNLPTRRWPRAPIHGDLHAENVRVRGDDAERRAQTVIEEAKARANEEAAKIIAAAKADAEQQVVKAREVLREQVASLAVKGAEQILQREVNAGVHAELLSRLKTEL